MPDRLQASPLCFNSHIVSAEPDGAPELGTSPRESKAFCVAAGHTSLAAYRILRFSVGQKMRSLKEKEGGGKKTEGSVSEYMARKKRHFSLIALQLCGCPKKICQHQLHFQTSALNICISA